MRQKMRNPNSVIVPKNVNEGTVIARWTTAVEGLFGGGGTGRQFSVRLSSDKNNLQYAYLNVDSYRIVEHILEQDSGLVGQQSCAGKTGC